jgi:hypothetical protein
MQCPEWLCRSLLLPQAGALNSSIRADYFKAIVEDLSELI